MNLATKVMLRELLAANEAAPWAGQSQPSNLTRANWMINEPRFAINSPHDAQVDPHQMLNPRFGDRHDERIWQVDWSICPRRKWRLGPWVSRAYTNTEWKGASAGLTTTACGLADMKIRYFALPVEAEPGL